jgi:spermidine/putrescine transport system permease protein
MILFYGLTNKENSFTLENLAAIAEPINLQALGLALLLSIISTVICLILSYPLSIILNNIKLKSNSLIIFIIILPMWMNFLLRTIAWQNILEKSGTLNTLLTFLHLPTINIINTPAAIILGMVYNYLPFMILPIYNVLIKIDQDVINAARDLGANTLQTFTKIIFPLSLPGVISGITMVFVPSLTTFAISSILGGSKILLMGNVIEQQFTLGNWHAGSGLSLVLMIFVLLCMAILSKYDKEAEGSNIW